MDTAVGPFEKDFVQQLMPHKFTFVLVDTIFEYSETLLVSGLKIQPDNILFENGNLTEAGLIEHMAQSVALHTGYQFFLRKEPAPTGYIGSIKEIEINVLPKLNDEIRTSVNILHEFAGITLVDISTKLNDKEIARGQMKTILAK
jgi:predicted hotdog family 3-hydroxylacyl-ACP dehydratase